MDLLHFYPLRGSLGRKPGRATQAKVRAKEKILSKYPNIKDITNIKIIKEEDKKNKISLNLFVTCLEDITEYQEIDNNKETS